MSPAPAGALRVVLLDVNGTLTDPAAIGVVWDRPELGERMLGHAVHTATVAALLGAGGRPFADHLRAGVEVVAGEAGLDRARVDDAITAAAGLPARPGAREALGALRDAGLRLVALTNSGAAAGERTLEANGLRDGLDDVLGVDAVATFKPDPAVYAHALTTVGEPAAHVALLATHPWDLAGAGAAGMATAWVRHGPRVWPGVFVAADVVGDTLPEVAAQLGGLVRPAR